MTFASCEPPPLGPPFSVKSDGLLTGKMRGLDVGYGCTLGVCCGQTAVVVRLCSSMLRFGPALLRFNLPLMYLIFVRVVVQSAVIAFRRAVVAVLRAVVAVQSIVVRIRSMIVTYLPATSCSSICY